MNLHKYKDEFENLCILTGEYFHISETNIKRDYYLVMMLMNLFNSEYANSCVFKGGTSLSKCYKNSINRFSEDIDLTFIPRNEYSNKQYDKVLKRIELIVNNGFKFEKINEERNDRNKSSWVWMEGENKENTKIKFEIGSSINPYPYEKRELKTYIQEYLEITNNLEDIKKYDLQSFTLNVLNIERTFLDKLMAVKRHAICGTLYKKTRHIYDIVMLFKRNEIKRLLNNKEQLNKLLNMVKETDSYYLTKQNISKDYNPLEKYNFNSWKNKFNKDVEINYHNLQKIVFDKDIKFNLKNDLIVLKQIDDILDNN